PADRGHGGGDDPVDGAVLPRDAEEEGDADEGEHQRRGPPGDQLVRAEVEGERAHEEGPRERECPHVGAAPHGQGEDGDEDAQGEVLQGCHEISTRYRKVWASPRLTRRSTGRPLMAWATRSTEMMGAPSGQLSSSVSRAEASAKPSSS